MLPLFEEVGGGTSRSGLPTPSTQLMGTGSGFGSLVVDPHSSSIPRASWGCGNVLISTVPVPEMCSEESVKKISGHLVHQRSTIATTEIGVVAACAALVKAGDNHPGWRPEDTREWH